MAESVFGLPGFPGVLDKGPAAMTDWYYAQQGQRRGPVPEEEMLSLIGSGQVQPSDLAWTRGMSRWMPVASISALVLPSEPAEAPPAAAPVPASFWARCKAELSVMGARFQKQWTWRVLVLAGALLLLLSFLLPWWGIWKKPSLNSDQLNKEVAPIEAKYKSWYNTHQITPPRRDAKWLWGPGTGSGIVGLIFTFFIVPLAIVPIFVKVVRPWSWIGSFITAVLGLVLLTLALVWFFGCPGEDVPPIFYQGMLVGPYVYFLASVLILAGSVTEGALGLLAFVKCSKTATTL
jgi:hypothetical protein